MGTIVRAAISKKNKYYINKHRHYELKHFCLQYPEWKRLYTELDGLYGRSMDSVGRGNSVADPTYTCTDERLSYLERMELIEQTAIAADAEIASYILAGVTEGLSYIHLKNKLYLPCGKDMYYDRYRRFFWLLDKARN